MSKIILEIRNEKAELDKEIDVTNYTKEEMCRTFAIYLKAGYGVYVAEGIEEILKRSER